LQPGLTFEQPVTGFQVASVHSIEVFALFAEARDVAGRESFCSLSADRCGSWRHYR
jgi:hypothetical protein